MASRGRRRCELLFGICQSGEWMEVDEKFCSTLQSPDSQPHRQDSTTWVRTTPRTASFPLSVASNPKMLSRLVRPTSSLAGSLGQLNGFQPSQSVIVRVISTTSPKNKYQEGPDRDLVNFPRPKRLQNPPAVSLGFISENYLKFFYPKTGVTGPWVFSVGLLTYLLSKEIWVLEHEFWNGVSLFIIIGYGAKKFGKQLGDYLGGEAQAELDNLNAGKNAEIKFCKDSIEAEKKSQWFAEGEKELFQAKRENVAFQVEAEYRQRLMNVYSEVRKRLDYQVEKQNVERNVQQKHMATWIINRVTKSITAEHEQENIKKCISDLRALATKA